MLWSFFGRWILVHRQARLAPACKSPKPSLMEFSAVWAYNPFTLFEASFLAVAGVPWRNSKQAGERGVGTAPVSERESTRATNSRCCSEWRSALIGDSSHPVLCSRSTLKKFLATMDRSPDATAAGWRRICRRRVNDDLGGNLPSGSNPRSLNHKTHHHHLSPMHRALIPPGSHKV